MAKVPANIPTEPGESRCGDSYQKTLYVNGLIPGTDFGAQFEYQLNPVRFEGGGTSPPLFENEAAKDRAIDLVQDRLDGIVGHIDLATADGNIKQSDGDTLVNIAFRGGGGLANARAENILPPAVPGGTVGGDRDYIRDQLEDALKHLRCAEYWLWRILLYNEARREYEPPFEPGFRRPGDPSGPDFGDFPPAPPLPPLPPPETTGPEEPPPPKKKEPEPKVSPWVIAGGLAVAGGLVYYFVFRKK